MPTASFGWLPTVDGLILAEVEHVFVATVGHNFVIDENQFAAGGCVVMGESDGSTCAALPINYKDDASGFLCFGIHVFEVCVDIDFPIILNGTARNQIFQVNDLLFTLFLIQDCAVEAVSKANVHGLNQTILTVCRKP